MVSSVQSADGILEIDNAWPLFGHKTCSINDTLAFYCPAEHIYVWGWCCVAPRRLHGPFFAEMWQPSLAALMWQTLAGFPSPCLFVCIWKYWWKEKKNLIRKDVLCLVEVVFHSCKSSKIGEQTHLINSLWYNERWTRMTAVIRWWHLSSFPKMRDYMTGSNNRYVFTDVETKICLDLIQISKNITNPNMNINLPSCQGDFLFWVQSSTSTSTF